MWSTNRISKAGYEAVNRNSKKGRSKQDKPEIDNVRFPSGLGNTLKNKGKWIKFINIK